MSSSNRFPLKKKRKENYNNKIRTRSNLINFIISEYNDLSNNNNYHININHPKKIFRDSSGKNRLNDNNNIKVCNPYINKDRVDNNKNHFNNKSPRIDKRFMNNNKNHLNNKSPKADKRFMNNNKNYLHNNSPKADKRFMNNNRNNLHNNNNNSPDIYKNDIYNNDQLIFDNDFNRRRVRRENKNDSNHKNKQIKNGKHRDAISAFKYNHKENDSNMIKIGYTIMMA